MPFVTQTDTHTHRPPTGVRNIFTGRANEQRFFVQHVLTPEVPTTHVIWVWGPAGVGKSTPLTRLRDELRRPGLKETCLTALVDEREGTPADLMERCAVQLRPAGAPLAAFEQALSRYKQTTPHPPSEQVVARAAFVREVSALSETKVMDAFVQSSSLDGRHRFHPLARQWFVRAFSQRAPHEEQAAHRALAQHYRRQLERRQARSGKEVYSSAEWLELALAHVSQLLCLEGAESQSLAIEQVLAICHEAQQERAIAQLLRALSREQPLSRVLLTSLRWLEQKRPDFYRRYAEPMLARAKEGQEQCA